MAVYLHDLIHVFFSFVPSPQDATKFVSKKTGRGPLKEGWRVSDIQDTNFKHDEKSPNIEG